MNLKYQYIDGVAVIPKGTIIVEKETFKGRSYMAQVEIPEGVEEIGDSAFEECSSLTQISIPSSVKKIGAFVFSGCSSLTHISIPEGVEEIGDFAFEGCSCLTHIEIPSSVTKIGTCVFSFCDKIESIVVDSKNCVYKSLKNSIFTKDGKILISGCHRSMIPNGVEEIGEAAFAGVSNLTHIEIPNSVKKIGDCTFCDCTSLTHIEIPNIIKEIGNCTFCDCTSLTHIVIPNSVKTIGDNAFSGCSSLTSIELPEGVIEIGDKVFDYCDGLTKIVIPDSVDKIGSLGFFGGCLSIPTIYINTKDPKRANQVLSSIKEERPRPINLHVPMGTEEAYRHSEIGKWFYSIIADSDSGTSKSTKQNSQSSGVTCAEISDADSSEQRNTKNTKEVKNASRTRKNFKKLIKDGVAVIPHDVEAIPEKAFELCSDLSKIVIPNSVKTIGDNAFSGCSSLTSIELPEGVIEIGDKVFDYCDGLTKIVIPDSVNKIGSLGFFGGCLSIPTIYINTKDPKRANQVLSSIKKERPRPINLHVPMGTEEAYRHSEIGKWFYSIIADSDSGTRKSPSQNPQSSGVTCAEISDADSSEQRNTKNTKEVKTVSLSVIASHNAMLQGANSNINQIAASINTKLNKVDPVARVTKTTSTDYFFLGGAYRSSVAYCSDNACPCPQVPIKRGCGYIYVEKVGNGYVANLTCEEGARLRNLDLDIAHKDAVHWWNTGMVPKRETPQSSVRLKQKRDESGYSAAAEYAKWYDSLFLSTHKQQPYYLFFDTETTGLPRDYKAPSSNTSNWPRMVQLSWISQDKDGKTIKKGNYIIKPEGFTIPAQASDIHGITTSRALRDGVSLRQALNEFLEEAKQAKILVGHNVSFDMKVLGCECVRLFGSDFIRGMKSIDTMETSTNYCAIPGYYGYKWPKLQELHRKLFGYEFEDAHDSSADIAATAKCFWEMKRRGLI